MRYDFNHIDQFGRPREINPNTLQKYAKPMSMLPTKSGYIVFLNNNINMNTVGNARYKVKKYFDIFTKFVSEEPTSESAMSFNKVHLLDGSVPRFWIYDEDIRKIGL